MRARKSTTTEDFGAELTEDEHGTEMCERRADRLHGSKQRYGPSSFSVDSRRLMSANYEDRMYCVRLRTEARREVAMPTYFFDLIKGNELVEDDQGEDFADIEAAKLKV